MEEIVTPHTLPPYVITYDFTTLNKETKAGEQKTNLLRQWRET